MYASPYTVWLLLGLGIARAAFFLIAYPPAHGADSHDYFLYAAQYKHLNVPLVLDAIYPLYPVLIYLTHYVLGSVYVLIGFQLVLSAVQGMLFYVGLRPYSAALGFLVALMVIGDAQTGILFNFTSTEPLYMFLLSAAFGLFLIQAKRAAPQRVLAGDLLLGVSIAALILTRPVGRYLIIPLGALFLLATRAWRRTAVVLLGFGLALAVFTLFNRVTLSQTKVTTAGNVMISRPVYRSGLLKSENGPASARLVELSSVCAYSPAEGNQRTRCLIQQTGSLAATQRLYTKAYRELIWSHPVDYGRQVFRAFTSFLEMSGQQYSGEVLPSDVQCANGDAAVARYVQAYLQDDWMFASQTNLSADQLEPIIRDMRTAMCPPWPHSSLARQVVDQIAIRYRSLSRPHPYLWYGALALAVSLFPWARRFGVPVLAAGAILTNHAGISALVLNVQPRYVAVTNPYKGIFVLTLLFIAGLFVLRMVDEWLAQRFANRQVEERI